MRTIISAPWIFMLAMDVPINVKLKEDFNAQSNNLVNVQRFADKVPLTATTMSVMMVTIMMEMGVTSLVTLKQDLIAYLALLILMMFAMRYVVMDLILVK